MNADSMQVLEGLFSSFDTENTGYINKAQLHHFCKGISLTDEEFETIFHELDSDGDKKISKADFIRGFSDTNDLLSQDPFRRDTTTLPSQLHHRQTDSYISHDGINNDSKEEHEDARKRQPSISWPEFIVEMGSDFYLLPQESQDQVHELYSRLTGTESCEMLTQFEDIVITMIRQVTLQNTENERLEKMYKREKESHEKHLRQLEEEMEGQVQKVEQKISEEQLEKFEQEKNELKEKLTQEIGQLQESLSQMQKNEETDKGKTETEEMKTKLDEIFQNNRSLQSTLTDAQTNLAVMRTELAQLRQSYAEKCRDLELERETLQEYIQEQENLTQQLHILHDANKKLHDTNDDLLATTDYAKLSPRRSPSREVSFLPHPAFQYYYYPPLSFALDDQMANRSQYVAEYVKSASMHNRSASRGSASSLADDLRDQSFSLAEELSQPERRPRLSPLPVQHSIEVDDCDTHEDVDSGHSTLQGMNEVTCSEDQRDKLFSHNADSSPRRKSPQRTSTPRWHPAYGDHGSIDRDFSFDDISEITELTNDGTLNGEAMDLPSHMSEEEMERIRPNLSRPGSSCSFSSRGSVQSKASSRASRNSFRRHLNRLPRGLTSAPERMYKIVLCGDAAVGKSSFILRLCKNMFIRNLQSTLGVDFQTQAVEVDGRLIALQLWDTAGQERFRSIAKSYFRRADGVFLLYDCTYERSFINVRDWMCTIEEGAERSIPVMLVANKTDLRANMDSNIRCISTDEGQRLARTYDAQFIETSAKEGSNILEAATEFARMLKSNEDLEVRTVGMKLHELKASKNKFLPDNCC